MTRQWSGCALLDERRNAIEIDLKIVTKKKTRNYVSPLGIVKNGRKKNLCFNMLFPVPKAGGLDKRSTTHTIPKKI